MTQASHSSDLAQPPENLRALLLDAKLAHGQTIFHRMAGGRTNQLWRYEHEQQWLVCKLFSAQDTPLFPNDPNAEEMALRQLVGTRLAPELVQVLHGADGLAMIYRHIDGTTWRSDVASVAGLLRRLHKISPPDGLRRMATNGDAILRLGDDMIHGLTDVAIDELSRRRPNSAPTEDFEKVFLHGDVVARNIIVGAGGLCLIDWQCPGIGDPTEDLAIFLSPAMQHVYGEGPLDRDAQNLFLSRYKDTKIVNRYKRLAPVYHWRMAAYCLWKFHHGDSEYQRGYELEIESLKALAQPDAQQG